MSQAVPAYRTLIRAVIEQSSALSVGGTAGTDGEQESCYRDGLGRLTIPGTSLAGAMIETGARLFPDLIGASPKGGLLQGRITGKQHQAPRRMAADSEDFLQSVWRFYPSHPVNGQALTEWRQGVGIRQATGATAAEKRALYDFECVPAGTRWGFFLEIDTHRGGAEAEALAVLALREWEQGRGWLGRGAARGTGWFRLRNVQVIRLPGTQAVLEAWPDNRLPLEDAVAGACAAVGGDPTPWEAALKGAQDVAAKQKWRRSDWHYLTIPVTVRAGADRDEYGWNPLHVGGHPAGELEIREVGQLRPLSVAEGSSWRGEQYQRPDAPFVCTRPANNEQWQPFLPGSGIRGALRHAVSRLARARSIEVIDPNVAPPGDPRAQRFRACLQGKRQAGYSLSEAEVRGLADPVTQAFGIEELCARVLVSDAALLPDEASFTFVRAEHHAEDEFAGGVYGTGKFDSDLLLRGAMQFRIVVEAPSLEELLPMADALAPALELARLGHLPIGGGKWRGAGWVPWEIGRMELAQAGDGQGRREEWTSEPPCHSIVDRLAQFLLSPSGEVP